MITQYFENLQEQSISTPYKWRNNQGIKRKLNEMGFSDHEYYAIKRGYFKEKYISSKRPTNRRA